jgi:hypothetical protein
MNDDAGSGDPDAGTDGGSQNRDGGQDDGSPDMDGGSDGGSTGTDGGSTDMDGGQDGGSPDMDAGSDGGSTDTDGGGTACDVTMAGSVPGAACEQPTSCDTAIGGDSACNPELMPEFSMVQTNADGGVIRDSDGGTVDGGTVSATLFPATMCGMGCDPEADTDPCGDCGSCSAGWLPPPGGRIPRLQYSLASTDSGPAGVCRADCTPEPDGNGGCRDGYTCDPQLGVCVEACENDTQCRLQAVGSGELTVNQDSPRYCNESTGRCTFDGDPDASAGDPCDTDADCPSDGLCIQNEEYPGGFCTKLYCDQPGFECSPGAQCTINAPRVGATACLPGCQVGQQDGSGVPVGSGASDDQCATGEACYWDRTTQDPDANPNGGCFRGNFNDITEPNTGQACTSDDECYSPFGYGACIFSGLEETSGMCSIFDVTADGILPGVPAADVCDSANNDIALRLSGDGEPVETACFHECTSASDCASGHACDTVGTDSFGNDIDVCLPFCTDNGDCRGSCLDPNGRACDSSDDTCFCDDA